MQETTAENRSRRLAGCLRWFVVAVLVFLAIGLVAPIIKVMTGGNKHKPSTRMMLEMIVTAINSYKVEYDRLPGSRVDGHYDDAAGNAEFFAVLRAMNPEQNPRRIVYFEARNVKSSKMLDGFDLKTGVLYDPYGHPYRIRVTPRLQMHADSPYEDVPVSRSEVIVWSTGPDGKQGNPKKPRIFAGSDDIYQGLP